MRKQQHIAMANEMLSQGDTFVVENNPVDSWTRRAKETKKNKKGKMRCKRRFGKSVAHHAPAMFVSILQNKVRSLGGEFHKVDIKIAATQFDFTNEEYKKHELKERTVTLADGKTHQRDMMAAFNLQHFRADSSEDYDIKQMILDYPVFCKLEEQGIANYIESKGEEKDTAYFAGKSSKETNRSSNRHNGGVERKHCNIHERKGDAAESGKKTLLGGISESLESVPDVPNEYHLLDHQHLRLDKL